MSLFSNLLNTYEKCSSATGISRQDADGEINEKKTFLPLFHTTFKSSVCVTLDECGNLVKIERDAKERTIVIPCTEESATSRTSTKIAPHPLCDQLGYIDKYMVEKKYNNYIKLLAQWKHDNKKLNAIYKYLSANSVAEALKKADLLTLSEKDGSGNIIAGKTYKIGVRFAVYLPDDNCPNVWQDKEIQKLWIDYQTPKDSEISGFDYLSGEKIQSVARLHPKNINSFTGNAKLISCNDKDGLTFRGRFTVQDEAVQTDTIVSQKMHQTLKWLINNFGYNTDTQVIIVWATDNSDVLKPYGNSMEMWEDLMEGKQDIKTDYDILQETEDKIDKNYAKALINILKGYSHIDSIKEHSNKIAVAIFDAATTGRMVATFYQEFSKNEYYENIAKWHEDSAWHLLGYVKEIDQKGKEIRKIIKYIGCPSFNDILTAVYGRPRGSSDNQYIVLKKKMQKQLLECMFGNFAFPKNIVELAAQRVSQPLSFTDDKGKLNSFDWQYSLEIACSLIKKYYIQQKEEISMELEKDRTDRDYLFGRLLAVADRLEENAIYKAEKEITRATNAIRHMYAFSKKPNSTWLVLWDKLLPYINQLNGATYFQYLIGEIKALFKSGDYESNKPLSALYLLGFSAQKRALKNNKEDNKDVNISE